MATDAENIARLETIYGLGVAEDQHADKRIRFVSGDELERRIDRLERRANPSVPRVSFAAFDED